MKHRAPDAEFIADCFASIAEKGGANAATCDLLRQTAIPVVFAVYRQGRDDVQRVEVERLRGALEAARNTLLVGDSGAGYALVTLTRALAAASKDTDTATASTDAAPTLSAAEHIARGAHRQENTMHPDPPEHIIQFFAYDHLPEHLRGVSQPFGELAQRIVDTLPRNPERTVALRKLLESKDAAVRAAIAKQDEG